MFACDWIEARIFGIPSYSVRIFLLLYSHTRPSLFLLLIPWYLTAIPTLKDLWIQSSLCPASFPTPLFPSTSIEWFIGIATMEAGGSRNALDHRRNAVKQRRDSTHRDNGRIPASKATGRWRNRKLHSKGRELRSEFSPPTKWAHLIRDEGILTAKTALSCRMAIILLLGYSDKFSKTGQYLRNSYWTPNGRKTNAQREGNLKETRHLEDPSAEGRILKWF